MNVDVSNFPFVRETILSQKLIQKSQFISFDLQFAGLKFQGNDKDRSEYMPSQKYQKMASVARKYCIMQVGITFFVPQQDTQNISAYPFNFYIFPRSSIYGQRTISLQSGCVQFNVTNKMDWNRWVEKGITYMKLTEYDRINDIQQQAKKFDELYDFLEEENKLVVDDIIENIKAKQDGENLQGKSFELAASSFSYTKKVVQKYFEQFQKFYKIEVCPDWLNNPKNKEEENIQFFVKKISKQQKESIQNKKLEQLIGFTLLFQKIWNSGKPFVGHNSFFDILFMYEAFIAPLPYDYQLFKKNITQVTADHYQIKKEQKLPVNQQQKNQKQKSKVQNGTQTIKKTIKRTFYDTKLISNSLNFQFQCFGDSTTLQGIYNTFFVKKIVTKNILLAKQYERYELKNQVLHEAGFDSYLTGWVFYQLVQLGAKQGVKVEQKYRGRVNLNRSYFYMNLDDPFDGVSQYQRVFYIEVVDQKKFVHLQIIRKQKAETLKIVREIFRSEDVIKDVIVHQGLKQVFIQVKDKKNYEKITQILVKAKIQKRIKDIYSLNNYLISKNAKQWIDAVAKNGGPTI